MEHVQFEKLLNTKINKIIPFRRNWLIYTEDEKKWVAKKIKTPSHLKWWLQVDKELRNRGFRSMPKVCSDKKEWLLSSYIEGKPAQYKNTEELKAIMQVIGNFHLYGVELFTPPPRNEVAFLLYHRLHDRLVSFYKILKISDQFEGDLGIILRTAGRDFYYDGLRAWDCIEKSSAFFLNANNRICRYICHRDLASHNWMLDNVGNPWLIDFDTAAYDCQVGDVWQITSRMLAKSRWDEKRYLELLAEYERVRPLSSTERHILSILHLFPNEFFREAIGLAKEKKGYVAKHSIPYIQNLAEQRREWQYYLKNN